MRLLNFLRRHMQYLIAAYDRWSRDEGPVMVAAVAYYVALSFFPLVLVLISGLGLFFRFAHSGQSAHQAVLTLVESDLSPSARAAVEQALDQVRDRSTVHGPIALGMMLFSAIAGFVQLQQAFDRIGNVSRDASKGIVNALRMVLFERLIAFLMLCGLALLVTAVFIGTMVLVAIENYTTGILPGSQMLWRAAAVARQFPHQHTVVLIDLPFDPKKSGSLQILLARWFGRGTDLGNWPADPGRCLDRHSLHGRVWSHWLIYRFNALVLLRSGGFVAWG